MADGLESLSRPTLYAISLLEPIVTLCLDIGDFLEDVSWKQYAAALVTFLGSVLILWTIFSENDYETIRVTLPIAARVGWHGKELDEPSIKVNFHHSFQGMGRKVNLRL